MDKIKTEDLTAATIKAVRTYMQTLDLKQTNKLPREEELAKQLGVSRITLRNALAQLATEGLIFRKQGKGTFVNPEALQIRVNFSPIEDFRQVIQNSGYAVDVTIDKITVRKADKKEAAILELGPNEEIITVEKMFYADQRPAVYCIDHIPLKLFRGRLSTESMALPLADMAEQYMGRSISWDKVELLTVSSTEKPFLAHSFHCAGPQSFLHCNVLNFDELDEPIIYSNEYIHTDLIRFNMIRQKSGY